MSTIRYLVLALVVGVLSTGAFARDQEAPSVTLPLGDYLEMKKKLETPSVTTIEEVLLGGDWNSTGTLTLTVSGASSGQFPSREFLEQSDGFSLSACGGTAMLEIRDDKIAIIPQKSRFSMSCKVLPKVKTELQLTLLNSLFLKNEIKGAELITRSSSPERKEIVLARTSGSQESGSITTAAYYRLTVGSDDSRFSYRFDITNPSRTTRSFEIPLKNHETVQDVQTSAVYEESKSELRLKLSPGENMVTVTGQYRGSEFAPLLDSNQQFLVVENHPLLQLKIESKARRISVSESGIAPSFASAVAFFLKPVEHLSWTSRKLAVFESQSYTVERANYLYYVPDSGSGIIEALFVIQNRGTPEISLRVPGTMTYEEIDGVAQALYKDEEGKLLVHLPSGSHRILVQYRPAPSVGSVLAAWKEVLVRPEAVISHVSLTVALSGRWKMLFSHGITQSLFGVHGKGLLFSLLVFALYAWFLAGLGISGRLKWLGAAGPAMAAVLSASAYPLALFLWCGGALFKVRRAILTRIQSFFKKLGWRWTLAIAGPLCVLILVFELRDHSVMYGNLGGFPAPEAEEAMPPPAMAPAPGAVAGKALRSGGGGHGTLDKLKGALFGKRSVPKQEDASAGEPEGGGGSGPDQGSFEGIPARIAVPQGEEVLTFSEALSEAHAPVSVWLGLINQNILGALSLGFLIATGWALYGARKRLGKFFQI